MKFHVIVPSYNCPLEVERCMHSLNAQTLARDRFEAVVINDASTDPEHHRVSEVCASNQGWTYIQNVQNMKAPYTIKQGIEISGANPEDVIVIVDGDDFLPPWALERLCVYYERFPELWLTYGQYQPHPNGWTTEAPASEYPTIVRWQRDFRTHEVTRYNHPITFKRFLWDQLDDADLQDDNGAWFTDGYDQVIMMPLLEMAAPEHYAFLEEVLYYYNSENPLSEFRLIEHNQLAPRASQVRNRPKRDALQRS